MYTQSQVHKIVTVKILDKLQAANINITVSRPLNPLEILDDEEDGEDVSEQGCIVNFELFSLLNLFVFLL